MKRLHITTALCLLLTVITADSATSAKRETVSSSKRRPETAVFIAIEERNDSLFPMKTE